MLVLFILLQRVPWSDLALRALGSALSLSVISVYGPWHLKLYLFLTLNAENIHGWRWLIHKMPKESTLERFFGFFFFFLNQTITSERGQITILTIFILPLTWLVTLLPSRHKLHSLGFTLNLFLVIQTFDTLSIPASEYRGKNIWMSIDCCARNKFLI